MAIPKRVRFEIFRRAMRCQTVNDKWKYFCGCCWTRVKQGVARACVLVDTEVCDAS